MIADVADRTTTSRALIKTLKLNLGILTFWSSDNRDNVTARGLSSLVEPGRLQTHIGASRRQPLPSSVR